MKHLRLVRLVDAAVCVAAATATLPGGTAGAAFHTYTIQRSSATYIVGKAPDLFPNGADDSVVNLGLPFAVQHLRNAAQLGVGLEQRQPAVRLTTVGRVLQRVPADLESGQPGARSLLGRPRTAAQPGFSRRRVHRDDRVGTAPEVRDLVAWCRLRDRGVRGRFEIVFCEGKPYFDFVYSDGDGYSSTIGVQKSPTGPTTQFLCNPGKHNVVTPGEKLRFVYS